MEHRFKILVERASETDWFKDLVGKEVFVCSAWLKRDEAIYFVPVSEKLRLNIQLRKAVIPRENATLIDTLSQRYEK